MMKKLVVAFLSAAAVSANLSLAAYEHRDLLYNEYVASSAAEAIAPGGNWFPYPDYEDRAAWQALFGETAPEVVGMAEKYLDYVWQSVPVTAYLAFERTGDRSAMETPYNSNRAALNALLLGELAEGKGRFMDQILDGMWAAAQMHSWVYSAHSGNQPCGRSLPDARHQIIDLASAGYGALTAVTYHFFKNDFKKINPYICDEIEASLREKISDPYFDESVRQSNWWMAMDGQDPEKLFVNNWNPWCNSNVLLAFLLTEEDPERLRDAVELSVKSVDRFVNYVKGDGACEEGTVYWEHAYGKLYDYLQIMYYATGGRMSLFDNPLIKDMCDYLHRSYIGDGYVVNFADASPRLGIDNTLIYRFGKACSSKETEDFALSLLYSKEDGRFHAPGVTAGNDVWRSLESVSCHAEMAQAADSLDALLLEEPADELIAQLQSVPSDVTWYPETQVCYMRNSSGWFLAAKGGYNDESHNHNDVGSFILYIDDIPVFVDAGVGVYTRQTFSHERYSIWTMQSDWHNLPMINGTSQVFGKEFRARDVKADPQKRTFRADISEAYSDAAACSRWVRSYSLGDDRLVIKDDYALGKRVLPDCTAFLVQGLVFLPGESYIPSDAGVPAKAVTEGAALTKTDLLRMKTVRKGTVVIANGEIVVELSFPSSVTPAVEVKEITDPKLHAVWGPELRRILFTTRQDAPCKASCTYVLKRL